MSLNNLLVAGSDHGPIYLSLNPALPRKRKPFGWKLCGCSTMILKNIVKTVWLAPENGIASQNFLTKVNAFQYLVAHWNYSVFCEV